MPPPPRPVAAHNVLRAALSAASRSFVNEAELFLAMRAHLDAVGIGGFVDSLYEAEREYVVVALRAAFNVSPVLSGLTRAELYFELYTAAETARATRELAEALHETALDEEYTAVADEVEEYSGGPLLGTLSDGGASEWD